jgi:superfamily II DNA or RNA helicase
MFDIERASRGKEIIQKQAVILSKEHDNLLLSWATGTSKTLAALKVAVEKGWEGTLGDIYILLKETNHEQNWRDEIKKWNMEGLLDHITFFCYASLHKYLNEDIDLLILDECHALSEMREDYLKTIKCDKIISLSATVNEQVKARIKAYKPGFYEYHIGLQEAIDLGILPEPSIKIVYVDLEEKEKSLWWKNKSGKVLVTPAVYYTLLQGKINMYEKMYKEGKGWAENKWIQAMGQRKKFMAKAKTDTARKLLTLLDDKRYICFTGSIDQCNELGGDLTIHSKLFRASRETLLEKFNGGEVNHIFAVGMLRESMNLNGIEVGVIVQLDNQSASLEQMGGRIMRSIAPEIYILVLRGTKDEDYFDKATRSLSSRYITEFIWPKEQEILNLQ